MKNITFIIILSCFYQIGLSQNFIGEIKYTISSISHKISAEDTISYYFDKDRVLIKHLKESVEKGGSLYDIYILSQNKFFVFDLKSNTWSEFYENSDNKSTISELDSIGTESFMKHDCTIYEYQSKFKNENVESNTNYRIWVNEAFPFTLPASFKRENNVFANGTGKIALKSEMVGTSITSMTNGTYDSTIVAVSISPVLSEEYQTILAGFQKWYGK